MSIFCDERRISVMNVARRGAPEYPYIIFRRNVVISAVKVRDHSAIQIQYLFNFVQVSSADGNIMVFNNQGILFD